MNQISVSTIVHEEASVQFKFREIPPLKKKKNHLQTYEPAEMHILITSDFFLKRYCI